MPKVVQTTSDKQQRDESVKSAAWYTALYYLAEHFREITDGALNHKGMYSLVGSKGRYINHSNPVVRKRTAGTLSRTIHTKRYAQDMRETYQQDAQVFEHAAERICSIVHAARDIEDADLVKWIMDVCWPDVRQGLVNESGEWRGDLDLFRLDCETSLLFSSCLRAVDAGVDCAEMLLSALLHAVAFGCLDVEMARSLVDEHSHDVPLLSTGSISASEELRACLVRFSDSSCAVLTGFWTVTEDAPFTIGRYTDCRAIEPSSEVSRLHCRIFWEEDSWLLEDIGSRNGSKVWHGDVYKNVSCGAANGTLRLEFGDKIELPSGSTYLFAQMRVAG